VGATPVFIDVLLSSGNIDLTKIEESITKNTKAICVVHFLGLPVNMIEVLRIAKKFDLFVIEDCALSLGTEFDGVKTGLLGDAGVYSFYPTKHITTGEGGMVVSKHKDLILKISKMKSFHYDKNLIDREIPGIYDVDGFGLNFRMSELSAALGIHQLNKFSEFMDLRKKNGDHLISELKKIDSIRIMGLENQTIYRNSRYCISVLVSSEHERNFIIKYLKKNNIGSSVYYPISLPNSLYYSKKYNISLTRFQNAQTIANCSIALPIGPHLTDFHVARIAKVFYSAVKELSHLKD
jgi:dTDP-4-amino-4,6-dideoxygalactose transaminase